MGVERVTISIDEELMQAFDAFLKNRGYTNRSEALRDLIRDRLEAERMAADPHIPCVAALTYVYDHQERMLGMKLMHAQHQHHDLSQSTLHLHIDNDECLETTVLQGPQSDIRHLADSILAQPGVRHGQLHIIPLPRGDQGSDAKAAPTHSHGNAAPHSHD